MKYLSWQKQYDIFYRISKFIKITEGMEGQIGGIFTIIVFFLGLVTSSVFFINTFVDNVKIFNIIATQGGKYYNYFSLISEILHAYPFLYLAIMVYSNFLKRKADPYNKLILFYSKYDWQQIKRIIDEQKQSNGHEYSYKDSSTDIDDITTLTELGIEAWGSGIIDKDRRFSLFRDWIKGNPNTMSILFYRDKPVGYVCVLPLNNKNHLGGDKSQFNITSSDIGKQSKYIYIQTIYLNKLHRKNTLAIVKLLECLFVKVSQCVIKDNFDETILYVEPATQNGENFLKYMGFTDRSTRFPPKSRDNNPFVFLELNENEVKFAQVKHARATINLIKSNMKLTQETIHN